MKGTTMTEDEVKETRAHLANAAAQADAAQIEHLSSALHLGTVILSMMEAIGEARTALPDASEEGSQLTSTTFLGHKVNGGWFMLSVASATDEDAERHRAMMALAEELPSAQTKH
jgi:hypothetical protein